MSISIWDYEKPLDAMMLSHDHIAALVMKHEQQIKDLATHLLEFKQSITPAAWVGLTDDEIWQEWSSPKDSAVDFARAIEAKLRGKNSG
jgi:hypothetical protein